MNSIFGFDLNIKKGRECIYYISTSENSFGITKLWFLCKRMAKYLKKVAFLIIMFMLLFTKLESRSLDASFMKNSNMKISSSKGCCQQLIQKSQFLKASFAKAGFKFRNLYGSKRLSPQGPDPRHHWFLLLTNLCVQCYIVFYDVFNILVINRHAK
jgi:hypothetical protein